MDFHYDWLLSNVIPLFILYGSCQYTTKTLNIAFYATYNSSNSNLPQFRPSNNTFSILSFQTLNTHRFFFFTGLCPSSPDRSIISRFLAIGGNDFNICNNTLFTSSQVTLKSATSLPRFKSHQDNAMITMKNPFGPDRASDDQSMPCGLV